MAKNLFEKAKKESKNKVKKDDKIVVNISGKEFSEKLKKFLMLKDQIEELKAELAMSQEYVKNVSIEEFAKLIEDKKTNVGSFVLKSEDGESIMVVPTKKYISIDEDAANNLKETYGDDIVVEETKYSFNNDVLMRNMEVINDLIQNSELISKEDKESLIEAVTNYSINKDALDKVYLLAKESGKSVMEVLSDIQPVIQNKNVKI